MMLAECITKYAVPTLISTPITVVQRPMLT